MPWKSHLPWLPPDAWVNRICLLTISSEYVKLHTRLGFLWNQLFQQFNCSETAKTILVLSSSVFQCTLQMQYAASGTVETHLHHGKLDVTEWVVLLGRCINRRLRSLWVVARRKWYGFKTAVGADLVVGTASSLHFRRDGPGGFLCRQALTASETPLASRILWHMYNKCSQGRSRHWCATVTHKFFSRLLQDTPRKNKLCSAGQYALRQILIYFFWDTWQEPGASADTNFSKGSLDGIPERAD